MAATRPDSPPGVVHPTLQPVLHAPQPAFLLPQYRTHMFRILALQEVRGSSSRRIEQARLKLVNQNVQERTEQDRK
jgi:hypothetical protein